MIIHELNFSGVPRAAIEVANGMKAAGIDVRLIVVGQSQPIPPSCNVDVMFLNVKRGATLPGKLMYMLKASVALYRFFRQKRSNHIFIWSKEFTTVCLFIKTLTRLPIKITGVNANPIGSHLKTKSPILRHLGQFIYGYSLSRVDSWVAQSEGIRQEMIKDYGVHPDQVTTIYPIISNDFYVPHQTKKRVDVLFVGRLCGQKNPFLALEIVRKIPGATCNFVGDGPLWDSLNRQVSRLDLQGRVMCLGESDDVRRHIRSAKVLILTSEYEGFGMVIAEAIACGVPVVSFDCPVGPAEIIIDGVNGYLIPQGNIPLFIEKLCEALNKDWDENQIKNTANKFHQSEILPKYIASVS